MSPQAGFIVPVHFKNTDSRQTRVAVIAYPRLRIFDIQQKSHSELLYLKVLSDLLAQALAHPMTKPNLTVLRDGEDQEGGESEA